MLRAFLFTAALLASPAFAQESYWIASRASTNIMEVADSGQVLRAVDMGTSLRSAHLAPDGKIWVIRFIQAQFDIVDPTTTPPSIQSVNYSLGNPFKIAFDNQGNGWVSGGSGVEQFDAAGNSLQTIPLANGAPLGITIDTGGVKWVAHRLNPGVLSRIDTSTPNPVITVIPLPNSTIQPVSIVADYQGLNAPSNIWVTGDPISGGAGEVIQLDNLGNVLNTWVAQSSNLGGHTVDLNGHVWVGDFRSGDLYEIDPTIPPSASPLPPVATFPPNIIGLNLDSFGRLWASSRITFSPPGPPCEVRRIDPANPTVLEHPGVLSVNSINAYGTQSALATPVQYSLVVDQFGDLDGDGIPNAIEVLNGTSAIDPASNGIISAVSHGPTRIGSTMNFDVFAGSGPSTFWLLAGSEGLVAPGAGFTLPGWLGELLLDPAVALPGAVSGSGSTNLPVVIPNLPALAGYTVQFQGFASLPPNPPRFTNITSVNIWM